MKQVRSFLLFLFVLPLIVVGQTHVQTIRGTITDRDSRMPLPGASVVIIDSEPLKGTTADITGTFRLEKVPLGRISLRISYIGYNDVVLSNLELDVAKELVLEISMEEKIYTGTEAVIKGDADKTQTINRMTTVSARTFAIEETEKYAGARSDIARMASNFAGVSGADDSRNDIIIRGNSPAGLLWRVDDVDIPNPNHFAGFGTTGGPICILRNNLLSNSDFLTAAFPADYGNAVSGVFDLKMINGNNEKHEFLAQIAFNGIEAGAEGPLHKKSGSSYIISYRYSTLDVFSKMGIQMGTGQGVPKYQDILFKINIPRTRAGSFTLFGFGGLSKIAFLDSKKDTTKEKIDFYGSEGWDLTNFSDQAVIGLTHMIIINPKTYSKFVLAGTFHDFRTIKDSVTPVTLFTTAWERSNLLECRAFGSYFLNRKISAKHNIRTGFSLTDFVYKLQDSIYRRNENRFDRINDFKGSMWLLQPYIEWQFRIRDNLTLNTGLHGQYLDYSGAWSIEPRIGIRWGFAPTHSFSIAYGLHSQMPTPTVLVYQVRLNDNTYHRTNADLGFICSHHAVFAWDWSITENTRIKAEIYYQSLFNVPVNATGLDSYSMLNEGANFEVWSPDTLANNGTGRNTGLEITLERFLSKGFYYLITGSLFDSRYKGSDGIERGTAFNGNYTSNLLVGKEFNLKFRKKKPEKRKKTLVINLKTTYSGGQRYTPINVSESLLSQRPVYVDDLAFTERFPDYSRTDLKIAYKMNGKRITIEWSVEVTNIFNQKNVYNQTFNRQTGETYYTHQLGTLIIPQYRIIF